MTSTTNKIMWAVGTVIVAILLAGMFGGSAGKVLGSAGAGITNLTGLSIDGTSPGTLTVNGATTLTGAVTVSSTIIQGGVTQTTVRQALVATATTTPCAIAFPTASSTLMSFAATITTATSSSMYYSVGVTTQFATSSSLMTAYNVGANTQAPITVNPTNNTGQATVASQYVTLGVAAGSPTYTNTTGVLTGGTCQAVFLSTN